MSYDSCSYKLWSCVAEVLWNYSTAPFGHQNQMFQGCPLWGLHVPSCWTGLWLPLVSWWGGWPSAWLSAVTGHDHCRGTDGQGLSPCSWLRGLAIATTCALVSGASYQWIWLRGLVVTTAGMLAPPSPVQGSLWRATSPDWDWLSGVAVQQCSGGCGSQLRLPVGWRGVGATLEGCLPRLQSVWGSFCKEMLGQNKQ